MRAHEVAASLPLILYGRFALLFVKYICKFLTAHKIKYLRVKEGRRKESFLLHQTSHKL